MDDASVTAGGRLNVFSYAKQSHTSYKLLDGSLVYEQEMIQQTVEMFHHISAARIPEASSYEHVTQKS